MAARSPLRRARRPLLASARAARRGHDRPSRRAEREEHRRRARSARAGHRRAARHPAVRRQPAAGRRPGRARAADARREGAEPHVAALRRAADLEAAYDNAPPISLGAKARGVAAIQQGMVDAGHEMPISTKSGKPDGIFGKETDATVRDFQGKNGLTPDGVVGRKTMGRLDELGGRREGGGRAGDRQRRGVAGQARRGRDGAGQRGHQSFGPDKGVWYDYNYFNEHQNDPGTYPWDDEWRDGLAPPEYFVRTGWMDWTLKPGKSASAAIQAWLKGLTIAECLSAIVAIEIETMRAALGNTEFDRRYGSEGGPAQVRPLRIHTGTEGTPLEGALKDVDATGVVRQARRQGRRLGLLLQPSEVPAQAPGRRLAGRERRLHGRRRRRAAAVHRPGRRGQDRGRDARRDGGRLQQRS